MSPRSFIVLEDSNDYARCSRDTKFKSMVLREIRGADDTFAVGEVIESRNPRYAVGEKLMDWNTGPRPERHLLVKRARMVGVSCD